MIDLFAEAIRTRTAFVMDGGEVTGYHSANGNKPYVVSHILQLAAIYDKEADVWAVHSRPGKEQVVELVEYVKEALGEGGYILANSASLWCIHCYGYISAVRARVL